MSDTHSQTRALASDYREFVPPVALREHVLCLWTQSIQRSRAVYAHRVLPDACVDIVFMQGQRQAPAVIGPWTESFVALLAPGTRITGVRFYPGKAAAVLGLPACELANQQAPLGDLWTAAARAPFAGIDELPTFRASRVALEAALLLHMRDVAPPDSTIGFAIRWLALHPGARIEQLSEFAGISSRQMQRRFSAAVGYGPKLFQSVLRFQRLLYLARKNVGEGGLADLAAQAGYADQAHMTREVRRFAGESPGDLLPSAGCTLSLADFLAPNGVGDSLNSAA
jgi:AraC-like DNA-binding protein